jgi:hypothetical protein
MDPRSACGEECHEPPPAFRFVTPLSSAVRRNVGSQSSLHNLSSFCSRHCVFLHLLSYLSASPSFRLETNWHMSH